MPSFADLSSFFWMLLDQLHTPRGSTALLMLVNGFLAWRQWVAGRAARRAHDACLASVERMGKDNARLRVAVVRLYGIVQQLTGKTVDVPPLDELLDGEAVDAPEIATA